MRLTVGSATDVGRLRALNEDSVLVADGLFAVADGMGGHRGGEVASARALDAFRSAGAERTLLSLMNAVRAANSDVFEHARTSAELTGMGTTLCGLAAIDDQRVAIVNVGDSRVYLLRDGAFEQVSEDHSFVESLVRDGRLTRAQADVHPQRNVLTRALGIEPAIDVDGWEVSVADGDRFLLCSDGLFNEVTDATLQAMLTEVADPVEAAGRLVAAANAHGGRDNISCIIVDVADVGASSAGATIAASIARLSTAADVDETTIDQPHLASGDATVSVAPGAVTSGPGTSGVVAAASAEGTRTRGRWLTWRTALFLLAIVGIFAIAITAVTLQYSGRYSIAERAGKVVILSGPSSKMLWITPQVKESTVVVVDDLSPFDQQRVRQGVEDLSLAAARAEVGRLAQSTTTTTTTTTSTTSTTTAPPDTLPAPAAPG